MEAVNGLSEGEKGGPPPPSPLTGCYLLVVIGEPHSKEHKDIILQRVAKGLLSWDVTDCLVDLEKELAIITEQAPEGEEARYGERLIQFASENLVTEVLIHPVVSTLSQCVRNLLSSFTRHRHIIHAGYTFAANGSWILQDGTFSLSDFSEAFQEIAVQRVIRAYENGISLDIHCSPEGDWIRLPKENFTKSCKVRVNPNDVLTSGSPSIASFIDYISPFLVPTDIETLLESSDVVGNIRFSHPTLYVFPGGQGDAALFGINGFNMLLDGGFSRKACFWDFVRHLDRLDAVLLTRLNNSNINGISSVLRRKRQNAVYPQIGHFFCNIQERKVLLSPDGDKDRDPLLINLLEEGQEIFTNLRHLNLSPQICYRDSEPINLYHKVGHGTLDMYVLSPAKDSKEVREFLQKWNSNDPKLFSNQRIINGRDLAFPIQNLVSICALLVWQPANPDDSITRILYPGSTPQHKIFEGLDRLKHLECIKHPVCSEKMLTPSTSIIAIKKQTKDAALEKLLQSEQQKPQKIPLDKPKPAINKNKIENKVIENNIINGVQEKQMPSDKVVKKSDSTESEKSTTKITKTKPEQVNGKVDDKTIEKPKLKPKDDQKPKIELKKPKQRGDSQQRKPTKAPEKKASPTTPKKTIETKVNGDMKDSAPKTFKSNFKPSPTATPAKSAKEANNRKVVESKKAAPPKRETKPSEKKEVKPERKPISRRPKGSPPTKVPGSPLKKVNGIQKPDSIARKAKLDKEGTTDSSTVSTPSADQDSILKKDISKLTPEELESLKAQELADLKEEQEVVKEIEAVFRKGEAKVDVETQDLRKVKDLSLDEKIEPEEYLIIVKEEVEREDSIEDKDTKEDETQKHARDSEESEKRRKSVEEEAPKMEEIQVKEETEKLNDVQEEEQPAVVVAPKSEEVKEKTAETSTTSPEEKLDVSSEKKTTDKDVDEENKEAGDQNNAVESQPDEKFSATVESGATTAPTLPEDERIPLDEIKEDNGDQVIEEKHVKEETKEKEVPVIQLPPKTFETLSKLPPTVGIKLEKQTHIRDLVKTPDEVADLPVHEEVDIGHYEDYQSNYKSGVTPTEDKTVVKATDDEVVKEKAKEIESVPQPTKMEIESKPKDEEKDVAKEDKPAVEASPNVVEEIEIKPEEASTKTEKSVVQKIEETEPQKTEEIISKPEVVEKKVEETTKPAEEEKIPPTVTTDEKEKTDKADVIQKKVDDVEIEEEPKKVQEEVAKETKSEPVTQEVTKLPEKKEEIKTIDSKLNEQETVPDVVISKHNIIETISKDKIQEEKSDEGKETDINKEEKEVIKQPESDITEEKEKVEAMEKEKSVEEIKDAHGDTKVPIKEDKHEEIEPTHDKDEEPKITEKTELQQKEEEEKVTVTTSVEAEKKDEDKKVVEIEKMEPATEEKEDVDVYEEKKEDADQHIEETKEVDQHAEEKKDVDKHAEEKKDESKDEIDVDKGTKFDVKEEKQIEDIKEQETIKPVTEKIDEEKIEPAVDTKDQQKIEENKVDQKIDEKKLEEAEVTAKIDELIHPKTEAKEEHKEEIEEKKTEDKKIEKKEIEDKKTEDKKSEEKKIEPTVTIEEHIKDEKIDSKDVDKDIGDEKHVPAEAEKKDSAETKFDNQKNIEIKIETVDKPKDETKEDIKIKEDEHELPEGVDKVDKSTEETKEQSVQDEIPVISSIQKPEQAESVVIPPSESAPESPTATDKLKEDDFIEKTELGRKSPMEREQDVIKIVASVAEVLKSDAPLEEFEGKLPFSPQFATFTPYTTELLRETHITTLDSPVAEDKLGKIKELGSSILESSIPEEPVCTKDVTSAFLDEERKSIPSQANKETVDDKEEKHVAVDKKIEQPKEEIVTAEEKVDKDTAVKTKEDTVVETKEEGSMEIKETIPKSKEESTVEVKEVAAIETKDDSIVKPKEISSTETKENDVIEVKKDEEIKAKEETVVETKETAAAIKEETLETTKDVSAAEKEESKEDAAKEIKEDAAKEIKEDAAKEIKEDAAKEIKEDAAKEIKEDAVSDVKEDCCVVHRMLVTASSEDGGEETVICPPGSITFSKSSESSGRSTPEPPSTKTSKKSSLLDQTDLDGLEECERKSLSGKSTPDIKHEDVERASIASEKSSEDVSVTDTKDSTKDTIVEKKEDTKESTKVQSEKDAEAVVKKEEGVETVKKDDIVEADAKKHETIDAEEKKTAEVDAEKEKKTPLHEETKTVSKTEDTKTVPDISQNGFKEDEKTELSKAEKTISDVTDAKITKDGALDLSKTSVTVTETKETVAVSEKSPKETVEAPKVPIKDEDVIKTIDDKKSSDISKDTAKETINGVTENIIEQAKEISDFIIEASAKTIEDQVCDEASKLTTKDTTELICKEKVDISLETNEKVVEKTVVSKTTEEVTTKHPIEETKEQPVKTSTEKKEEIPFSSGVETEFGKETKDFNESKKDMDDYFKEQDLEDFRRETGADSGIESFNDFGESEKESMTYKSDAEAIINGIIDSPPSSIETVKSKDIGAEIDEVMDAKCRKGSIIEVLMDVKETAKELVLSDVIATPEIVCQTTKVEVEELKVSAKELEEKTISVKEELLEKTVLTEISQSGKDILKSASPILEETISEHLDTSASSRKTSVSSGKTTPDIKSITDIKELGKEEALSGKSTPDLSKESLLISRISTPEVKDDKTKDTLSGSGVTSGKSTPDVKEISKDSLKSTPVALSRSSTPECKQDSGRSTPEVISKSPAPEVTSKSPTPEVSKSPAPEVSKSPAPEVGKSPAPEVSKSPAPEVCKSPAPEVSKSPAPEVSKSPAPEVSKSPAPEISKSPAPEISKSPAPEISKSPAPEISKSPAPEISKSPAPEISKSPAPEISKSPAPEISKSPAPELRKTECTIKAEQDKAVEGTAGPSSKESSCLSPSKSPKEELHLSGKSTPDIAEMEIKKEDVEKLVKGSSTPPTVPVSPVIKEEEKKKLLETELRSSTPASVDSDLGSKISSSLQSDAGGSGQASHASNLFESDKNESDEEEDMPGSPLSVTSQVAHSRSSSHYDFDEDNKAFASKGDQMSMSFYGSLPDDDVKTESRLVDDGDLDFEKAMQEHRQTRGEDLDRATPTYLYEVTKAKFSTGAAEQEIKKPTDGHQQDVMTCSFIGTELPDSSSKESKAKDSVDSWGKPLGLPSPAPPSDNKGTPKKERKLPPNVTAKNKLNDDKKRSESPSKYDKKQKRMVPIYVDLTYVPHHGNANYSFVEFFKRVRARYYVFSGIEPSKEVYNALLEAKQTWEDKELEVTIIPTYDTDILGYWVAENEDLLAKYKIDLSPSASRCTINLQDHETSCSAYRLEF